LEAKGCILDRKGNNKWLINQKTKEDIARVSTEQGLFVTEMLLSSSSSSFVFNICNPNTPDECIEGSLMEFHRRLGHVHVDRILRLAKDPNSGIKLTDTTVETCVSCAEGKQSKNKQSLTLWV
jgi:hypothetical protein